MPRICSLFILPALILSACCPPGTQLLSSHRGPEDLAVLDLGRSHGLVTATSDKRLGKVHCGAIQVHDPSAGGGFTTMEMDGPGLGSDFNPSGIHVVADGGVQWIYVCNSAKGATSIELFQYAAHRLHHAGSIPTAPFGFSPNGITVTRDGTVYASMINMVPGFCLKARVVAQAAASCPLAGAVYRFKPMAGSRTQGGWLKVAVGINGANGLALTADEGQLLVSSYHENSILMFDRDRRSGRLIGEARVLKQGMAFHPDNLKPLGDGRFSVCGQYSRPAFLVHAILGMDICHGGAAEFCVRDGAVKDWKDLSDRIACDGRAPSTCLRLGKSLYVAHVTKEGVTRVTP